MFETLKNAWKIVDLRKKILFTLFILVIYRLGCAIPVPFIDPSVLQNMMGEDTVFGFLNAVSGGAFEDATVLALGVIPYINAQIIIQLLTIAIPALERLAKEGEDGRKKLNAITRYSTIGLAILQGFGYYLVLKNQKGALLYSTGVSGVLTAVTLVVIFTAGAMLAMWLGDQITDKGIGNGISFLIFANITARLPTEVSKFIKYLQFAQEGQTQYFFYVPLMIVVMVATIVMIIFMNNAERRISVQYAKRVVGRKMYGGQNTHIPIKVNMSGVLPIIFASSFLALPATIRMFVSPAPGSFWDQFFNAFSTRSLVYGIFYFLLIIAFNYFYVAVQYNPIEIANNLRKNNGGIPGIRPGKPTSDFIGRVVSRITFIGALFLGVVATLPIAIGGITNMSVSLTGTSLIIVVGVALETVKTLESQMMMRHYKGFLE
ncbi:preprotein translocase subunit SecY [Acetanaerobacterium elongatum]|uniref:Protein translocase subunit SecY n=1 Tax=Acetanaerobacterium elongatum TaxID=258515 RepID=A0A1G9XIZ8_9FIRM|nr:preprotein translocase subunit SecY [Acetanaerobacterium elongatum]SDM96717.1 protein translocase subunit secY/sec61 alpha [Acetanaerobacterium elongatum]